jgi:hypothetical protein
MQHRPRHERVLEEGTADDQCAHHGVGLDLGRRFPLFHDVQQPGDAHAVARELAAQAGTDVEPSFASQLRLELRPEVVEP